MSIELFISIDILTIMSPTELSIVLSLYFRYYQQFLYKSIGVEINRNMNSSDIFNLSING